MRENFKIPEILYEDKYILIVNKPAGLIVQGAYKKEESFLDLIKSFIKERDKKPGNVFLGVVHRLDKLVSGALIWAKRSKIAKRLFESFQKKEVFKIYLAEVEGCLEGEGLWENYLLWDERKRKTLVFNNEKRQTKKAITYYFSLEVSKKSNILLIPLTGRKHQLRAVLSKKGFPIVGDLKYGSKIKIKNGKAILLHALFLKFPHPMTKENLEIIAPLPEYFSAKGLDKKLNLEFLNKILNRFEEVCCVSG
ncbi:RluA family pseudouridine synthase [Thermodesulfobacterium hydrogeniphilum]|uniref:RluA family pseudouridine synthase n=1 Tax=Thermodesulfobacterium hydrogeniphilum TaxID=161156 RepID=UPI000691FFFC|nr:RluA family pseudouridine synthase [Thermodesulfobacterium hydrogeniphilum]